MLVNSGYYRMAPGIEESDTYPVKIDKGSIVPGTIYYDPNGHIALVYQVNDDGRIRLIDAHPDKSVSRPWFGSKFARGSAENGGGFRRWRPMWYGQDSIMKRQVNINIPDFSPSDQYQSLYALPDGNRANYFDYVRVKISGSGGIIKPVDEFRLMLEDIFEDLKYRAVAIDICLQSGVQKKEHPGFLPWNIYGTDGEWEQYSTPSRDARLKVAFAECFNRTVEMISMAERGDPRLHYTGSPIDLARELIALYEKITPSMIVTYTNSIGRHIDLNYHDIVKRLFALSFDPYHSAERRWGASGQELLTATDNLSKRNFYDQERRLRNQLERLYNCSTGLEQGPEKPADVDIRQWLCDYVERRRDTSIKIALSGAANDLSPVDGAMLARRQNLTQDIRVQPVGEVPRVGASFSREIASGIVDINKAGIVTTNMADVAVAAVGNPLPAVGKQITSGSSSVVSSKVPETKSKPISLAMIRLTDKGIGAVDGLMSEIRGLARTDSARTAKANMSISLDRQMNE
ncbi:MAG: hypothetical protein HQM09_25085 [Candidatus Riflebacteria bacterium]|nr:hypothetical protein [Candidatus Riflebacteria bacterium]